MSNLDPQELRRELLLEQAINRHMDALVKQATATITVLGQKNRMEVNQLRNLLNVALQSRSVEVVLNFIRYQIARESAWGRDPNSFGHTVIEDIQKHVRGWGKKVVDEIITTSESDELKHDKDLLNDATVRLMQLYLGYLNRVFYYAKRTDSFESLKEIANV